MRTRILRGLTKERAAQLKIQYEATGWTAEITPDGVDLFQLKATKNP